jgi:hypothetical protein
MTIESAIPRSFGLIDYLLKYFVAAIYRIVWWSRWIDYPTLI